MPVFRLVTLGLAVLVVSSCTPDSEVCADYGFDPGTNGYAGCMMQRQQNRFEAGQAALANMRQNQLQQQMIMQNTLQSMQPHTSNSNCYVYGNNVSCQTQGN